MNRQRSNIELSVQTEQTAQSQQKVHHLQQANRNRTTSGKNKPAIPLSAEMLAAVQHGLDALQQNPEVRDARIAELQAQINVGTYHIESTDIARKVLKQS